MSGKRAALVMTILLVGYLVFVAARALDFIAAGGLIPVLLGLSLLFFPALGIWVIWREWRFGRQVQRLGGILSARGELPVDDLPRRPSGRVDREAADARFAQVAAQTAGDPQSWPRWFALAVAYDNAGDRKRARAAMRRAIAMESGRLEPGPSQFGSEGIDLREPDRAPRGDGQSGAAGS